MNLHKLGIFMKKRTRDLVIAGALMVFGAGALIASNTNLPIIQAASQSKNQPPASAQPLPNMQPVVSGTGTIQSGTRQIVVTDAKQDNLNQQIQNAMPTQQPWSNTHPTTSSAQGPAAHSQASQNSPHPTSARPSAQLCATEALAVGIKHFWYEEAVASDLVWSGYGSQSDAKYKIHRLAKPALQELTNAAKREGITLTPGSIFRGVARQRQIVSNKRNQGQSPRQIYRTSSHPGYSEHHTGLAVDFTPINDAFARTPAYRWLRENAHRYGWYQSFDKSYSQYSGIAEESWHWRYEGKNAEFAHIFAASKNRSC